MLKASLRCIALNFVADAQLFGLSAGPADKLNNELQDPWAPTQNEGETQAIATEAPNAPSQGASYPFRPGVVATSVWERYHRLHNLFWSLPVEAQGSRDVSVLELEQTIKAKACHECMPFAHIVTDHDVHLTDTKVTVATNE